MDGEDQERWPISGIHAFLAALHVDVRSGRSAARPVENSISRPLAAPAAELESAGVSLGEHYPERLVNHDIARRAALQAHSVVKT
jgi:hypothetical protein